MPAISFPTSPTIGDTVAVSGKTYIWDGAGWKVVGSNVPIAINDLTDVDTVTTSPVSGNYLKYNGTNWTPGTVVSALSGLSDVTLTSPANNNYLTYNSSSSKWVNSALSIPSTAPSRNKIINGDMRISQKMRGSSVANDNYTFDYVVDKFYTYSFTQNGLYTSGKNLLGPVPGSGFNDYLGVRVGATGYNFAANGGTYGAIHYVLEGSDVADLNLGTSSAKAFTISFWFYASVTGTYSLCVRSRSTTTFSDARYYIHNFTISAVSTWTYVTATIPGSTDGPAWTSATGRTGLTLMWMLGAGSVYTNATVGSWIPAPSIASVPFQATTAVNFLSTANAALAITGVQLEAGTTATSFESTDFSTSLNRCRRYFYDFKYTNSTANDSICPATVNLTNTIAYGFVRHPVEMAKPPAVSNSGIVIGYDYSTETTYSVSAVTLNHCTRDTAALKFQLNQAAVTGRVIHMFAGNNNGVVSLDANILTND